MQVLQGPDPDVTADARLDALHGRGGALHGGHARDADVQAHRADLVAVDARARVPDRGVDDEVNLARGDPDYLGRIREAIDSSTVGPEMVSTMLKSWAPMNDAGMDFWRQLLTGSKPAQ